MTAAASRFVVGIGGSTRPASTTEVALRVVLRAATEGGAKTRIFSGDYLRLGPYEPGSQEAAAAAGPMLDAIREADAVVIASPGYHGTMSGLTKNVLDYLEELRQDVPPYLTDKPIGCIATAYGWQAAVNTLTTMRQVVHALRGWPSPLGAAINTATQPFTDAGECDDPHVAWALSTIAGQLLAFADKRPARRGSLQPTPNRP